MGFIDYLKSVLFAFFGFAVLFVAFGVGAQNGAIGMVLLILAIAMIGYGFKGMGLVR